MYIYRVENDEGVGCYSELVHEIKELYEHTKKNNHPLTTQDQGIYRFAENDEIHGFLDLDQAMNWFTSNEFSKMARHGQKLRRVKVKEITAIGEHQILAIR